MRLGEKQVLKVVKEVDFGIYLAEDEKKSEERVLLPIKQVPEGIKLGDEIEVFLYKDSEDRLIATTREPKLVMGKVAKLDVVQVTGIGAFLDWGLDKDLFLPFKQQTRKVAPGDNVLVSLYIDKSSRLCATMNVYESLISPVPYALNEIVAGTVYQISQNFGAFVAVEDKYSALIPKKNMYGDALKLKVGQFIEARVSKVMEDGRLELTMRDKGYLQRDKDADELLLMLQDRGGKFDFTDKASPELIREETGMSKAEFKRAVGKLYKERKIVIEEACIRMV